MGRQVKVQYNNGFTIGQLIRYDGDQAVVVLKGKGMCKVPAVDVKEWLKGEAMQGLKIIRMKEKNGKTLYVNAIGVLCEGLEQAKPYHAQGAPPALARMTAKGGCFADRIAKGAVFEIIDRPLATKTVKLDASNAKPIEPVATTLSQEIVAAALLQAGFPETAAVIAPVDPTQAALDKVAAAPVVMKKRDQLLEDEAAALELVFKAEVALLDAKRMHLEAKFKREMAELV